MDRPRRDPLSRILFALLLISLVASCGSYDRNPPETKSATTRSTTTRSNTTTTAAGATTTTVSGTTTRPSATTTRPGATTTSGPTTSGPSTTGGPTTQAPTTTVALANKNALPQLGGSLALVDDLGRLLVTTPRGESPVLIADATNGAIGAVTWSADASRLAWAAESPVSASVNSAGADGKNAARAIIPTFAPYVAWAATRTNTAPDQLVYARPASDERATVESIAVVNDATPRTLGQERSAYFWLSPNGNRVALHLGDNQLVVYDLATGTSQPLAVTAGPFRAPVWLDDNRVLVAVRGADRVHTLSSINVTTGARTDHLRFEGAIDFVVDPAKRRVAYQITGGGGGSPSSPAVLAPEAVLPQQATTTTLSAGQPQLAAIGRLSLLLLDSNANSTIAESTALAFTWSPSSNRLAFLLPRPGGAVQWRFWSTQDVETSIQFTPNTTTQLQVQLFSQFEQSYDGFSPDGRAFAFTGRLGTTDYVFVAAFNTTTQTTTAQISKGSYVTWSPR